MSYKRVPVAASFTIAVVLTCICSLVMVKAQTVEGSGSLDDDEDGFDLPTRPTRLIDVLTPTISRTQTVSKSFIASDRETDPIYVGPFL